MAHSLANMAWKKATARPAQPLRQLVTKWNFYQHSLKYSSTTGDSDTHEDFQPTNKVSDASISWKNIIEQDIKENTVMIYMKGIPDAPRCGFSAVALRVLQEYGVPISARNILENDDIKSGVKSISHWPTFPQIFIKGEFIGGSDILLNMHQTGELKEKLKDINTDVPKEKE